MPPPTDDELATWRRFQWANALIMRRFKDDLARSGLSVEEFDVLVHLWWSGTESVGLQELTSSMIVSASLTRSGITRLLDRMERDGLVRRTLSARDRRRFDVSLTPRGTETIATVWPDHAEGIRRFFVDPLGATDMAELGRIVAVLVEANEE